MTFTEKIAIFFSALPVTMLIAMVLIDVDDDDFKVIDFWWMWPLLQVIVGIVVFIC